MTPERDRSREAGDGAAPGRLAHSPEILARIFEFAPDAKFFVDPDGLIIEANSQAEKMFGYSRDELIGQPVEILIPRRFSGRHVEHRSGYMASPRSRPMGAGMELWARRKDGSEIPVDIMLGPLDTGHGTLALAVVRDISERRLAETQARQAREMYLRELHHRVKNNLQVISSLLFLQSRHTKDSEAREILEESRSRVKSIALIHEKLYRSPDLTRIDLSEYVRDLVSDLFSAYGPTRRSVSAQVHVDEISLDIDTAIPCGLIINELVSNALKHAFPGDRKGVVTIELRRVRAGQHQLTIRDDGVGLPEGLNWDSSPSLGLKLIKDLARQIDGEVELRSEAGTTVQISFKEVKYRERS